MSTEQRLYGLPGAESMHFDPETVYETSIEPYVDEHDRRPQVIEEWSVLPPISHVPLADSILEYIVEWVAEDGMITEGGYEQWDRLTKDPEIIAAAENLRTVLASKVQFRMADRHLRDHLVSWDEEGEPLLDNQPMYVPAGRTC